MIVIRKLEPLEKLFGFNVKSCKRNSQPHFHKNSLMQNVLMGHVSLEEATGEVLTQSYKEAVCE